MVKADAWERPSVHRHHHYRHSATNYRVRDSIVCLCVGDLNERHTNSLTFLQRTPSSFKRPFHQFSNYPSEIQVTTWAQANAATFILFATNWLHATQINEWENMLPKMLGYSKISNTNIRWHFHKWMKVNIRKYVFCVHVSEWWCMVGTMRVGRNNL